MLQKFLDLNFIQIQNDENLNKLRKASREIVKKLVKNKAKIISYTLIALDPDVKANNSDLNEVKKIILKNWRTFVPNSGDTPITIIRAVILDALESIAKEMNIACVIWHAGRNVIKHFRLDREHELLTNFLLDLGNKIEKNAVESWTLSSETQFEKLSIEIKKLTGVVVEKTNLQKYLVYASGPHDQQSETPYKEPNPHWPNVGENWSYEFAPRAAQGISLEINKALKEQAEVINTNQIQIQEVINTLLFKIQSEFLQKNIMLHMRTQLLWWKEACFSESLKQSYRELKEGILQVALANDYSSFVPSIYPTSANYFLKETHRVLTSEEDKKMKISEILKLIKASSEELKVIFVGHKEVEGRILLINFLKGLVWNSHKPAQIKNLVGISATTEITLDEFALWLFHDLQALNNIKSK